MSYLLRTKSHSPNLSHVADLYGHIRQVAPYKRGCDQAADFRDLDVLEPLDGPEPDPAAIRLQLRQAITDALARYKAEKLVTDTQLRTIRALWLGGLTLREIARREGVSVEAVRARIEGSHGNGGVAGKAPEFYQWWSFKNRRRRRKE